MSEHLLKYQDEVFALRASVAFGNVSHFVGARDFLVPVTAASLSCAVSERRRSHPFGQRQGRQAKARPIKDVRLKPDLLVESIHRPTSASSQPRIRVGSREKHLEKRNEFTLMHPRIKL